MSFPVMINSYIDIFDLYRKQNKEICMNIFVHFFVDSGIVKTCDELDLSLVPPLLLDVLLPPGNKDIKSKS